MITKRYTVVRTSLGDLFITADRGRIVRIDTVRPHVSVALRRDRLPLLQESAVALIRFLNGTSQTLTLSTHDHALPFVKTVYEAVKAVPYGTCITSAELAERIGKPHAVRAVETVCRNNPLYIAIPSHRIVFSDSNKSATHPLSPNEALRRLEKRYLDKDVKRR